MLDNVTLWDSLSKISIIFRFSPCCNRPYLRCNEIRDCISTGIANPLFRNDQSTFFVKINFSSIQLHQSSLCGEFSYIALPLQESPCIGTQYKGWHSESICEKWQLPFPHQCSAKPATPAESRAMAFPKPFHHIATALDKFPLMSAFL